MSVKSPRNVIVTVLVRISVAVEKHHDNNSYKGEHLIGDALQFRTLIHCHHGGKHSSLKEDMALEKEIVILHLDQ